MGSMGSMGAMGSIGVHQHEVAGCSKHFRVPLLQ
jgi:hypothetical protein